MACCQCNDRQGHCNNCVCVRGGRPCQGCNKGDNCNNRYGNNRPRNAGTVAVPADNAPVEAAAEEEDRAELERGVGGEPENRGGDNLAPEDEPNQAEDQGNQIMFWKNMTQERTEEWVNNTYKKVIQWPTKHMFDPPMCNAAKEVIKEMTSLLQKYNNNTPLASLALKIQAILPQIMFQRTHNRSKTSENVKALKRRIEMWNRNELKELVKEANALQERANKKGKKLINAKDKARQFGDKLRQGKVAAATRSLTADASIGVLQVDENTLKLLQEKHPAAKRASEETKLQGNYEPPPAAIYERITGEMVWKKAVHTQGGAGPSGIDAKMWKILLSKNKFGAPASDLSAAIALLARKLATEDCRHLEAFTACRLIPLAKKPTGCRPIGIGEVIRRIIGKCIMEVVKEDVRQAAGNLQVCAGQQAGGEAAIHSMRRIFDQEDCEAVLMVDASNAFNAINREAMLHNINIKCPSFAKYVTNTYRNPASLFISNYAHPDKGKKIMSTEGTTQGDPVAMAMYALGMSVLQHKIRHQETEVQQIAYADDLTGAGTIDNIKTWWDQIKTIGPALGYNPNATKSVLIVKEEHYQKAQEVFGGSDVEVTKDGQRHLGAVIGTNDCKQRYVKGKVEEWVKEIRTLSDIAKTEPHAAYTAFTYGVRHRWTYLMRTIPDIGLLLHPLEEAVKGLLIPALTNGHHPDQHERALLALPPRLGGLGIPNPEKMADQEHQNSLKLTGALVTHIIHQDADGEVNYREQQAIRISITKEREEKQKAELENTLTHLNPIMKRRADITREVGASNWLTTLPIKAKGFSLNKQEFMDAIALRYGWPVEGLPHICPCGEPFNQDHAMKCKKGGFVCIRHDEVRNVTAEMLREVCHDVTVEPVLLPLEGEHLIHRTANRANEARVDVSARGFWTRGQRAFFDIRVFDPMAQCHRELELAAAHGRNEREKCRQYEERIINVDHGSFAPLVFTTSGGMGSRARCFYGRLAELISDKKNQPRSCVVAWMRTRLSFSLLRSSLLCLRGTRSSTPRAAAVAGEDFDVVVAESRITE